MIKARPNVDSEQIKQLFLMIKYTFVLINVKINRTVYHLERCVKKLNLILNFQAKFVLEKPSLNTKMHVHYWYVANVFFNENNRHNKNKT